MRKEIRIFILPENGMTGGANRYNLELAPASPQGSPAEAEDWIKSKGKSNTFYIILEVYEKS